MYRKEEDRSYAALFAAVTLVLILGTALAFWREAFGLRPWKYFQRQYYSLEQQALAHELREARKRAGQWNDAPSGSGLVTPSHAADRPTALPDGAGAGANAHAREHLEDLERRLNESKQTSIAIQQIYLPEIGVVDRCKSCHLGIDKPTSRALRPPFASHPGQFLFLEPHPPDRTGCTVCHGGQGRATSSVSKAHGEVEHWGKPLLAREHVSASCWKCHGESVETLRGAENVTRGAELFRRYACYGCHSVAGFETLPRPGPPLRNVGQKINYSWLVAWIKSPRRVVADARMPDFGFTDAESHNIADFLFSFTRRERVDSLAATAEHSIVEAGKELFNAARCSICHRVEGKGAAYQTVYAPDLTAEGSKIQSVTWIADRIGDPALFYPDTAMPRFRFTADERRKIAAYMGSELVDGELEEKKLRSSQPISAASAAKGKELVQRFGCFSCHEIPGFEKEGKIGADLSKIGGKPLEQFDFSGLPIPHNRAAWFGAKLKNPRGSRGDLRMPDYRLAAGEIQALTTFLLGLSGEGLAAELLPGRPAADFVPAGPAAKLINDLKCLTCHSIRGRGGRFAPDLTFEGSAVEREWLKRFLKAPDLIRPMLEQMPRFYLSDEEVNTLADFIRITLVDPRIPEEKWAADAGAVQAGKQLYEERGCRACHQLERSGGAVGPSLTGVGGRLTAGYLLARTRNARIFRPGIVEPHYGFTEQQAMALAAFLKILDEEGTTGKKYVAKN